MYARTVHYIAFEGIEGAGKSTVAAAVADALDDGSRDVVLVREPGGTSAGERIRDVLLDRDGELAPWTEALLFAAARAQLAVDVIGPALAAGSWVVSDRSVYSSLAYQGGGRELGVAEVRMLNEPGLGKVWPTMVVLLRVDPASGLARQDVADRIGAESLEFQARVAAAYEDLASQEPDRIVVVDASRPLEDVATAAYRAVLERW